MSELLLPAAPVVALVERECGSVSYAARDPRLAGVTTARTIQRARRRGTMRLCLADSIVTALGHHPAEVFGPEFYANLRD